MTPSNIVSSKVSLNLPLPPSCAQFCPAYPDLLVVGTYNLEQNEEATPQTNDRTSEVDDELDASSTKTPQSRNGSLLVFRLENSQLTLVETFLQPSAILDLRFHPLKQDVFAVVSSTGTLTIFKLNPSGDPGSPLVHVATSRCRDFGEDVLFLQCNWHPFAQDIIGVTTSAGSAILLRLDGNYQIKEPSIELDIGNSLEAWCIAFSPSSNSSNSQVTAFCGGDDSMLRYMSCDWDSKASEPTSTSIYSPVTVKGVHAAGVTAILPLSLTIQDRGRLVLTGSYDDHLRMFIIQDLHDSYGAKRVELILEQNMGGGVWRLDLVDSQRQQGVTRLRVLASCMHAGARLVEIESDDDITWSCSILARFEEHKSMNYGSDFVRPLEAGRLQCVSTSFYDKLLCLWEFNKIV